MPLYEKFVQLETALFMRRATRVRSHISAAMYELKTEVERILTNARPSTVDAFVTFLHRRQPTQFTYLLAIPGVAPKPWQTLLVPTLNSRVLFAEAKRYGYNLSSPSHVRLNLERLYQAVCRPHNHTPRDRRSQKDWVAMDETDDEKPSGIKLVCEGSTPFSEAKEEECRKWMWLPDGATTFRVTGISPRAFAHFTAYLSTLITTKKLEVAAQVLHPEDVPLEEIALLYYFAHVVKMEPLALLLADRINLKTPEKSTTEMAAWLDTIGITKVSIAPFV